MPVIYGQVGAPSNTSAADSSNLPILQGKAAEGIVAQLHGRNFTATYRGRGFIAATAAAGVTIPISSSTAPTFTLYNPIGSGIVTELVSLDIGITVVTSVASPLLLGLISGLTVAPTGLTARTVISANLGGPGTSLTQFFTAATLAAAASNFLTVGQVTATNATAGDSLGPFFHYDFDGRLLLQPGALVHLCGTAAQTSATTVSAILNEWPL